MMLYHQKDTYRLRETHQPVERRCVVSKVVCLLGSDSKGMSFESKTSNDNVIVHDVSCDGTRSVCNLEGLASIDEGGR
jgi:hypothetical protein